MCFSLLYRLIYLLDQITEFHLHPQGILIQIPVIKKLID